MKWNISISPTGKVPPEVVAQMAKKFHLLANQRVTIVIEKYKESVSSPQLKYWWGVVVKAFVDKLGYTPEEMHEIILTKIGWVRRELVDGEEIKTRRSITEASVQDMNDNIAAAQLWGSSLGIYVPDPNQVD